MSLSPPRKTKEVGCPYYLNCKIFSELDYNSCQAPEIVFAQPGTKMLNFG